MDTSLGRWEIKISSLNFSQPRWALKYRTKKIKRERRRRRKANKNGEQRTPWGADEKKNLGKEKERSIEKEK